MPAVCLAAHPYAGLWAAIATMHGKERAIAPVFCRWFNTTVTTAPGIDTDKLGTFTGEIPRMGTMVDAARAKALLAIERTGADLGIGSEGAFGPHHFIPLLASGQEVMVLREAKTGHEIIVHRHTRTNFAHISLGPTDDPSSFLQSVGFPEHAVVVQADTGAMAKGLQSKARVEAAMREIAAQSANGKIMMQTDMRAHLNPTRMATIGSTARRLAARAARCCSSCGSAGFGMIDVERGLRCVECGFPTDLVRAEVHGCTVCGNRMRRFERPKSLRAEARFCELCNP